MENSIISKELLSEVLQLDILKHKTNHKTVGYDYFKDGVTYTSFNINIYELAHKCKEWAKNRNSDNKGPVGGYPLFSKFGDKWDKAVCFCDKIDLGVPTQKADTEPEAIFKTCEWILNAK